MRHRDMAQIDPDSTPALRPGAANPLARLVTLRRFEVRYMNIPGLKEPMQPLDVVYAGAYAQDEWRATNRLMPLDGEVIRADWLYCELRILRDLLGKRHQGLRQHRIPRAAFRTCVLGSSVSELLDLSNLTSVLDLAEQENRLVIEVVVPNDLQVPDHQLAPNPTIRPVRSSGVSPGTTKTFARP